MQGINVLLPSNENTQGGVMEESNSADHGISKATGAKGLRRQSISDVTSTTTEEEAQEAAAAIDKMMAASVTATANAFVSRVYSANIFSDLYVIQESARQHSHSSSPRLRKSRHLTYEEDDRRLNGRRNDTWEGAHATYSRKRLLSPTIREFILRRPQPTLDDEQRTRPGHQHHRAHQEETTRPTRAGQEQEIRHIPVRRSSFEEVKMMDMSERRQPTKSKIHKVSSRAA